MTNKKETFKDRLKKAAGSKSAKTKVEARVNLARVGLAYFAGDVFEIDAKIAKELQNDGLVNSV